VFRVRQESWVRSCFCEIVPQVLFIAGSVGLLGSHYERPPLGSSEGFGRYWRGISSYNTSYSHEESKFLFVSPQVFYSCTCLAFYLCLPKGSARASHVLSKRSHNAVRSSSVSKDIHSPCAKVLTLEGFDDRYIDVGLKKRTEYKANNHAHGYRRGRLTTLPTGINTCQNLLPPIIAPIFTMDS
jgi:hypothetical protein